MGRRREEGEGLEARLRLISLLFFAVGVAVLSVTVNTPLRSDEDVGASGRRRSTRSRPLPPRSGWYPGVPVEAFRANAFAVVPVMATVFIALIIEFSGGFDSLGFRFFVLVAICTGFTSRCGASYLGWPGSWRPERAPCSTSRTSWSSSSCRCT